MLLSLLLLGCFDDSAHISARMAPTDTHEVHTYLRFQEVYLYRLEELPPDQAARIEAGEAAAPFSLTLEWPGQPPPDISRLSVTAQQDDTTVACTPTETDGRHLRCTLRFAPVDLDIRYTIDGVEHRAVVALAPSDYEYDTYNAMRWTLLNG